MLNVKIVCLEGADAKAMPKYTSMVYGLSLHQEISPVDQEQRLAFSSWIRGKLSDNPDFLQQVWFSDEAHFHLDGGVNSQNCRIWASEKSEVTRSRPLQSPR